MFTFVIDGWQAWAPGLATRQDWCAWADAPYTPLRKDSFPVVDFLPAMQRRRLTPMARMVFASAWPLAQGLPAMPMVFASQHGDTPASFAMLNALAASVPLSPTHFGLSVHNAIPGLWSILRQETAENIALSAHGDTLEQALLEAHLLLNEGATQVMVTIAEIPPPHEYGRWIDNVPFAFAIALRIRPGDDWQLTLDHATPSLPGWHAGLNTLACLLRGELGWASPGTRWHWQRIHA